MITSAVAILFAVGYLLATVWLCRGIRLTARDLCLGGIVCAMTLVLATIRIPPAHRLQHHLRILDPADAAGPAV